MRIDKHVYDEVVELLEVVSGPNYNKEWYKDQIVDNIRAALDLLKHCRKAMHVSELSDEDIEAMKNTKYPEGNEYLDELMED